VEDCKLSFDSASTSKGSSLITAAFVGLLFVAGNLSTGIYPVYVTSFLASGRATTSNVGMLATSEFLPFGLAIVFAGRFFNERRLRLIAGVCLVAQLFAAAASTELPFAALVWCRALVGIAGGTLIWLSYAYIARSAHAGKLVAVYTTALMTVAVIASWVAPAVVMPAFGPSGVFLFLAAPSVLALTLLSFGPNDLPALPHDPAQIDGTAGRGSLPPAALLVLLSVGMWSVFMTIFWVYSEPLAAKHTGKAIEHWLTVSLTCQILGAALAAPLAERLSYKLTLTIGLALSIAQVLSIMSGVGSAGFLGWTAVFGFFGWFLWPFFVAALTEMDQTRRSIVYLPAAQNLAGSLGPLIVSQVVSETDLSGGLIVDLVAIGMAPVIFWAALMVHTRANREGDITLPDQPVSSRTPNPS
jgi:MFS family permease